VLNVFYRVLSKKLSVERAFVILKDILFILKDMP